MSKIAHTSDSSKRKLASSTISPHVHVCIMSDRPPIAPPWYATLYPYTDAASYDPIATRRGALQSALRIDETTAEKNREWIHRICSIAEVTPTQLARAASLSPSTLNRFLKQTSSSANLSASTLASIMETAERLIDTKLENNLDNQAYLEKINQEPDWWNNVKQFRMARDVTIIGRIKSGDFVKCDEVQYTDKEFFEVKVPVKPAYEYELVIGLEYQTEFPGEFLSDGDLIFCIPFWKQSSGLKEGSRVVVSRRNHENMVETSLRDVFFDRKGGCWLGALGGEADKIPPVFLGKEPLKLHGDDLSVSFVVVGSYHGMR